MNYSPFENTDTDEAASDEWRKQASRKLDIGAWFKVPNKFFGSGMAQKVGTSASVLFCALCENANRNNPPSNTFKSCDNALASETGLSPRTMRDARIRLFENGLIKYQRDPGQCYTYTLLRQELKWITRSKRLRQKRKPRAMAVSSALP